jgi:hypothetical protein
MLTIRWTYWLTLLLTNSSNGSTWYAVAPDPLSRCWKNQVQALGKQYIQAHYRHQRVELEHGARPWQQTPYQATGRLWLNAQGFRQSDTLFSPTRQKTYFTKTQTDAQAVLLLEHGTTKVSQASRARQLEQPLTLAPYSPLLLIEHAYRARLPATSNYNSKSGSVPKSYRLLFTIWNAPTKIQNNSLT